MAQLKVGTGAWVVVCDGRKILILENKGDDAYPDLRTVEHREQETPKTSEPTALVLGLRPALSRFQISTGNVVSNRVSRKEMTNSSQEKVIDRK